MEYYHTESYSQTVTVRNNECQIQIVNLRMKKTKLDTNATLGTLHLIEKENHIRQEDERKLIAHLKRSSHNKKEESMKTHKLIRAIKQSTDASKAPQPMTYAKEKGEGVRLRSELGN